MSRSTGTNYDAYTTLLAPVGDDTIFGGTKPIRLGDVKEGLSNTIWLVEIKAEFAKPWTAPEDYVFDATNPAFGLTETSLVVRLRFRPKLCAHRHAIRYAG